LTLNNFIINVIKIIEKSSFLDDEIEPWQVLKNNRQRQALIRVFLAGDYLRRSI
jgi:hypothetical protein